MNQISRSHPAIENLYYKYSLFLIWSEAMVKKWEYYVSTVIADENDRVKTAEKLEVMMKKQGVAGWELVNVVPFGSSSLYAIYKRPLD